MCKHRRKEISGKVAITSTFNALHLLAGRIYEKKTPKQQFHSSQHSTTSRRVFMGQASQLFSYNIQVEGLDALEKTI